MITSIALITSAIILSEKWSHYRRVYVSAWNKTPHVCMVFCFTERWWLIWHLPSCVAMSSPLTIFSWWMASRWNTGSSEGITNVTGFNHLTNGFHFNSLRSITFRPYKHNILLGSNRYVSCSILAWDLCNTPLFPVFPSQFCTVSCPIKVQKKHGITLFDTIGKFFAHRESNNFNWIWVLSAFYHWLMVKVTPCS